MLAQRPWEQDADALDDALNDGAFDWRVTAAVFALLWAAFTSLVMSVAPPTWGGIVAWFIATAAMGLEVLRQRHLWRKRQDTLLAPAPTTALSASAPLQAIEERPAPLDVDRVEEGLDEDPA